MRSLFHPTAKWLASGSDDGRVMLWDIDRDPNSDVFVHNGMAPAVAISPDGSKVVSSGTGFTTLWDASSRTKLLEQPRSAYGVAYAPDGKSIALTSGKNKITIWGSDSWEQRLDELEGAPTFAHCLTYSPDGQLLAAGNWLNQGGQVVVWDLEAKRRASEGSPISYNGPMNIVDDPDDSFDSFFGGLAFSPDGKYLAIPRASGTISLWEVAAQRLIPGRIQWDSTIQCVAFSPDSSTLASARKDTIVLWDVETGERKSIFKANQARVQWLAFSPDGTTLASSGSDGAIKLWSLVLNREVAALQGHDGPLSAIAFSNDGCALAAGGFHPTVRIWRAAARDQVIRPQEPTIQRKSSASRQ